ncbi:MAG: nucleotidyltransferase domain-containing protein [Candidatus Electryonea clarkiae]|nr:nucleotidyltransferase domain-containing protein [Candidatus Electryonea clarkiae]
MMSDIPQQKIDDAVESWKEFWKDDLLGIYLYGSVARGDWSSKSSDINLLLLLKSGDYYDRWFDAAALVRRRFRKGIAVPLVLNSEYMKASLDVYPMEFLDMKLFHQTIFGDDIFEELTINPEHLRLQAEREIKGKWVQLRQAALEHGGNTTDMRNLLAMTMPTWVSVFQALIFLEGSEVPAEKKNVVQRGAELANLNPEIFLDIERLRRLKSSLNRVKARELLLKTLREIDLLSGFIDKYQSK